MRAFRARPPRNSAHSPQNARPTAEGLPEAARAGTTFAHIGTLADVTVRRAAMRWIKKLLERLMRQPVPTFA
jgi:hypothetical protein